MCVIFVICLVMKSRVPLCFIHSEISVTIIICRCIVIHSCKKAETCLEYIFYNFSQHILKLCHCTCCVNVPKINTFSEFYFRVVKQFFEQLIKILKVKLKSPQQVQTNDNYLMLNLYMFVTHVNRMFQFISELTDVVLCTVLM
jgi:hypothetical protein